MGVAHAWQTDQRNRTEGEIDPNIYESVAYGKGDKSVGKDGLFNTSCWNE